MLTVISPAKTLDFETAPHTKKNSQPQFLDQSADLVATMREQTPKKLVKLMGISPKLAELNAERYQDWQLPFTTENAKPAVLAFRGDVYLGLEAENYSERDFNFAQKNLRILSGLYGLLRPLDLIQPYRLEMGIKLKNSAGNDLYEYWHNMISDHLSQELDAHRNKTLINLASNEYFKAVRPERLPGRVVTPIFKDYKNGTYKILSFFAKKARGYMASYIVHNRINKPDDIKSFDIDGYRFNPDLSAGDDWVFTRKAS
ncbi:MAG: peroxide stress protein YaaA [Pseudomonadales bacterium]